MTELDMRPEVGPRLTRLSGDLDFLNSRTKCSTLLRCWHGNRLSPSLTRRIHVETVHGIPDFSTWASRLRFSAGERRTWICSVKIGLRGFIELPDVLRDVKSFRPASSGALNRVEAGRDRQRSTFIWAWLRRWSGHSLRQGVAACRQLSSCLNVRPGRDEEGYRKQYDESVHGYSFRRGGLPPVANGPLRDFDHPMPRCFASLSM